MNEETKQLNRNNERKAYQQKIQYILIIIFSSRIVEIVKNVPIKTILYFYGVIVFFQKKYS